MKSISIRKGIILLQRIYYINFVFTNTNELFVSILEDTVFNNYYFCEFFVNFKQL